jgi:hypothetical protein
MREVFLVVSLLFSVQILASDFTAINIFGWTKEEISSSHLRFSTPDKKELTIHLQIDSYNKDEMWNEKTLNEDIKKMEEMRNQMSSFMGIDNYKIESFKQKKLNSIPLLELKGTYTRLKNQSIKFIEINFYKQEHFLQVKIISEGKLPSDQEIEQLIKSIDPEKVKID